MSNPPSTTFTIITDPSQATTPYILPDLNPIGEGGAGIVYITYRTDDREKRPYAVKLIQIDLDDPRYPFDEIVNLAYLSKNNAPVPRFYESGLILPNTLDGNNPLYVFIIMDYIDKIEIDENQQLQFYQNAYNQIREINKLGIFHTDISPEHIVPIAGLNAVFIDWGESASWIRIWDRVYQREINNTRSLVNSLIPVITPDQSSPYIESVLLDSGKIVSQTESELIKYRKYEQSSLLATIFDEEK